MIWLYKFAFSGHQKAVIFKKNQNAFFCFYLKTNRLPKVTSVLSS